MELHYRINTQYDENLGSSAFGKYKRGTCGHVLNALLDHGVPMNVIENIQFKVNRSPTGDVGVLMHRDKAFGTYRYFPGIHQPLFRLESPIPQNFIVTPGETYPTPDMHLVLGVHNTTALVINAPFPPGLWKFIHRSFSNHTNDQWYQWMRNNRPIVDEVNEKYTATIEDAKAQIDLRVGSIADLYQDAGAFFQGGSHDSKTDQIYLEFYSPQNALPYIQYLNANYRTYCKKQEELFGDDWINV